MIFQLANHRNIPLYKETPSLLHPLDDFSLGTSTTTSSTKNLTCGFRHLEYHDTLVFGKKNSSGFLQIESHIHNHTGNQLSSSQDMCY